MSKGTLKKQRMVERTRSAERQAPEKLLADIARFATEGTIVSEEAYRTARYCLMDSLGCGLLALRYPACTRLLGPVVPGAGMSGGARVPGTAYELDPVRAAFNIGCMIRWLDYNDTWLAAEWGHPSDNFGGILAVADYRSRMGAEVTLREVLTAAVKAYEIQGVLALDNAFNRLGLDHVILVRVASTAVVTALMGGSTETVFNALTQAFLDGGALRTYRHAPNTGSRKSWAAADATSRAVWLALISMSGEMGYPTALSAPVWGFTNVVRGGNALTLSRELGSYVMENILFKVAFPAEFHAQTAVEAAVSLHPGVSARLHRVERIVIETQGAAMRIIDKVGPLDNPADRDHCLQYITAIGLIFGELTAAHYEDAVAADPRIDALREKMDVEENKQFSRDYMDPSKRSIANALEVVFQDGTTSGRVEVAYPVGHRRRRKEGIPLLEAKFVDSLRTQFTDDRVAAIRRLFDDPERMDATSAEEFMDLFVNQTQG